MLILSPRAVERLESYKPAWPLPKIFRLTKGGKLIEGIFEGETINTPSMLCVEDYLDALQLGEVDRRARCADRARRRQFRGARPTGSTQTPWLDFSPAIRRRAPTPRCACRSSIRTSRRSTPTAQAAFAKASSRALEKEGVAYDIGAYRDAPPGLRIWCGATVETLRSRGADALARLGLRRRRRRRSQGRGLSDPRPASCRRSITSPPIPTHAHSSQGGPDPWPPRSRLRQALRRPPSQIFKDRGVEVDYLPDLGKDKDKLLEVIGQYDGLAIRSATKVTEKLIAAATKLKVIGRAGIGVDNVDIPAATATRHHRDEHAVRQFDHHRRARHRA